MHPTLGSSSLHKILTPPMHWRGCVHQSHQGWSWVREGGPCTWFGFQLPIQWVDSLPQAMKVEWGKSGLSEKRILPGFAKARASVLLRLLCAPSNVNLHVFVCSCSWSKCKWTLQTLRWPGETVSQAPSWQSGAPLAAHLRGTGTLLLYWVTKTNPDWAAPVAKPGPQIAVAQNGSLLLVRIFYKMNIFISALLLATKLKKHQYVFDNIKIQKHISKSFLI